MKKGILFLLALSGLSVLSMQAAYAGNRAGAVTLTPGAAYDFFSNKRNMNNTWLLPTVALAYNFDERWAIEGSYGTFGTSPTKARPGPTIKGGLYTVDGVYRFLSYRMIEPYVSLGVGAYHINPNGNDAYNQGNANAGLGVQAFFSDSIALRTEVRDIYTFAGGHNDVTVGLGVSFLIGGNAPAPVAPANFKN